MTTRTKNALMIAGFALLGVFAVAGWTRQPSGSTIGTNNLLAPNGVYTSTPDPNRVTYGEPVPNCEEPVYSNAAYTPAAYPRYRTSNRPRVIRSTNYVERDRVVVTQSRRNRSKGKSAAIVAGSAGVGAGIGALAGGGKGAAIGAISGGAAGFVYDRLTHNK